VSEQCGHKLVMGDTCVVLILGFTTIYCGGMVCNYTLPTLTCFFASFVAWLKTYVQETLPPVPEGKTVK